MALSTLWLLRGHEACAHSVAQVQTTKFFAPETVQLLIDRASAGHPGLLVGDTVNYIIQFTPVENANNAPTGQSNYGANGYVTDYIPPGAEVVGAWIVTKDFSGNYIQTSPSLPGGMDDGWGIMAGAGDTGQQTFNAPFNSNTYDPTGRCAAGGYTNRCNSRLTGHVADTGVFFSTDSRTSQYPPLPTRIQQGTNGYYINPTGAGQLNPIIGQNNATTHNLWDADQTNAFGTSSLPGLTPRSYAPILLTNVCGGGLCPGYGAPPYFSGSPVAGPQTGYQLDNTGQVGPWNRVYYPGSRIADASTGPATSNGNSLTAINGFTTSVGWSLSASNPLPAGTNALRWAVGRLTVGEIRYVKISLRLTAPVPSGGLLNSSEVFGADTSDSDDGAHNTWRYMVPSVADNNSNLFVLKTILGYCTGGISCTPVAGSGNFIPANAKVRYQVVYLNSGNASQTNVILSDTLPCQTVAAPVSSNGVANTVNIVSGPITSPSSATLNAITAGANGINCTAGGRRTFFFPTLGTLGPGVGGSITYDVLTNAAVGSTVPNTATLASAQQTPGINSNANSFVQTAANLIITKSASAPSVAAGGTATYTISVTNSGSGAASNIIVTDLLPTSGGTANAATRFSYLGAVSTAGLTAVTPTTSTPPTLTPYNSGSVAANQQQVQWSFGVQTLAAGASATIVFTATVGAGIPASATPYYNSAVVQYTGGSGGASYSRLDANDVAAVNVTSSLSVTKSIACFYNGASCVPYSGNLPPNAKVRYQIDYSNTGGSSVTGALLSDQLPCQAGAAPISYNGTANMVNIVSGPIVAPTAATLGAIAAGVCGSSTRQTFSFPSATIPAGASGSITYDVQTSAATGNIVVNTASLSGTGASIVTSEVQSAVQSAPQLSISKSESVTGAKPGNTVSYTLTVTNVGTANATAISVHDWLPAGGAALNPATRFSFLVGSSAFGGSITSVSPTVVTPPTKTPYNNIPVGSNINAVNTQEVVWNFGAQTLAPGASFTITYNAAIGVSVPAGYYNNNSRVYFRQSTMTGTIAVTSGSINVTGTGTLFTTQLSAGNSISINGVVYTVAAIASATSLTLTTSYAGANAGGLTGVETSQVNSQAVLMYVSPAVADVAVTKSNGVVSVPQGGTTSYNITVTNNGPDAANNSVLVDAAVAGLSKTGVTCLPFNGAVCPVTLTVALLEASGVTIPTLPSGGFLQFTVPANVTAIGGAVTNSATVSLPAGIFDSNWNNNTASDSDPVILLPTLTVVKSATPATVNPGQIITYQVNVLNSGAGVANSVVLTDQLSPYVAWSLNGYGAGIPFSLTQGAIVSGLTLGAMDYSSTNGSTWGYTPTSGGGGAPAGYDGNVTNWKLNMNGTMNAGNAAFILNYKVMVK